MIASVARWRRLAAVAWAAFALASGHARATDAPGERPCEGTPVTVAGASPQDHVDICVGVRQALRFLAQRGLDKTVDFSIEATTQLPDVVGRSAAGCFVRERNRAYVLTYAEFLKKRRWFGVPISRELYRALATHESAHAISACHFSIAAPSIQAMEYIAYSAMFATMPDRLRARALAAQPGSGFDDLSRVSSVVYLFDPVRFGTQSYRHFAAQADGTAVLRQILSGEMLSE